MVAVPLSAEVAPYVCWGDWVPAVSWTVTALAVLAIVPRSRRRPGRGGTR